MNDKGISTDELLKIHQQEKNIQPEAQISVDYEINDSKEIIDPKEKYDENEQVTQQVQKKPEKLSFKQKIAHLVKNNQALMKLPFIKHFIEKQVNILPTGETSNENAELMKDTQTDNTRDNFIRNITRNGELRKLLPVNTMNNQEKNEEMKGRKKQSNLER